MSTNSNDRWALPKPTRQALALIRGRRSPNIIWRTSSERPTIALTIDDGPDPTATSEVLDALEAHATRATFFFLTTKARRNPDLVKRAAAEGHVVGLHSDIHAPLHRQPTRALTKRLLAASNELERLSGSTVRHHRPPFGLTSRRSLRAIAEARLNLVMWSHEPEDWKDMSEDDLVAAITDTLVPGAIVLLHDGSDAFPDQGRRTARALRETIPLVRERGLQAITLDEIAT